ncbi:MAG: LutC/YkgG family protein [Burkholderiales bacterium]
MSARDTILARIRMLQNKPASPTADERAAVADYIRSRRRGPVATTDGESLACFRERALSLATTLDEVATPGDVPRAVAAYLQANALPRAAVCWPEFLELDWAADGISVEARPVRGDDAVGITGAFCAIAETGTLMLLSGARTPSALSLVPETHIAIVRNTRVVRTMEDAWQLLRDECGALPRAVNFISGPSRTADIEQTVTLGAHGPYRVHLVLVADAV